MNSDDTKKNIADALKSYRLEREWTLEEMATVTGLNLSTIHRIEEGKTTPHDLTIHILKRKLPGFMEGIV
jgi:transcriptional regulator with XRE-family HTH domain